MDPSALLTNLKAKIETSQRNIENYQHEVAEAEAKIAALQIHIHNFQFKEDDEKELLEKLNKSRVRLEETVAALAEEWGLASDSAPVPVPTPGPVVQSPATTAPSKKTKKETAPVPTPAPAPAPAPVENVKEEMEEQEEEGESSFEVTFKGVKYVVFEDNNEVIRADDESEEVIGNWDPSKKTIVFA